MTHETGTRFCWSLARAFRGAYDGHITFYEPMITQAYLEGRPDLCAPIKQPQAWEIEGVYPTTYCIRYLADDARYTVSLENFVHRPAG